MPLLIVVLWLGTVPLFLMAVSGPRRWFRVVTSAVRPGPEPTDSGYSFLLLRNWVLALVALGIVLPVTIDSLHLSQDELLETTELAVGLVPGDEVTSARIEAETEVLLDRDVDVNDVTQYVPGADQDGTPGVPAEIYFKVTPANGDSESAYAADADGAVVCVVTTPVTPDGLGERQVAVHAGGCTS